VPYGNAHQRVTSAEDFKNQLDRMTHFVDTSQPLSSATNRLMNKAAIVGGMEVMCGLSNTDFHSPRLWPLLRVQSASSKDQPWAPDVTSFPGVTSQLSGGGLLTLNCFHHGRGSILFLLEYFGYGFALPAHKCFCQNYYLRTYRILFIVTVFHKALLLIKKFT